MPVGRPSHPQQIQTSLRRLQNESPSEGWLRRTRLQAGKTQAEVAGKLGIQRQAYANFETGEVRATLSLASLRRAAQAMDCELVYYLVPKTNTSVVPATAALAPAAINAESKQPTVEFVLRQDRSAEELPLQLL